MCRIWYGYSKTHPAVSYVSALKCDDQFYVITKQAYEYAQKKAGVKRVIFFADLPVYVEGINI